MKETKVYVDELPKSCEKCPLGYFYDCQHCFLRPDLAEKHEWCEKDKHCPLIDIKTHDRELVRQVCEKIIKFINELAWKDIQYDAFQSTIGEFSGSTSAIPRYAKKYFKLWKEMFNDDLEEIQKEFEK